MRNAALIIVVLLTGLNSYSQDCSRVLTGKVIDFHDGVPLEDATITYNDTSIRSDAEGNFKITGLCSVSYAFTISHPDCNSQVVTIDMNEVSTKNFYLEHHLNELEAVQVVGDKKNELKSTQKEIISEDILEKYSSASLGDALREATGVSSLNTGATLVKPIIQGLSGSRVVILNNGVRMQDMEWGDEHAPNVDINSADNITIVKGASALKYGGDAIGGIIIMNPQKVPAKDTLFGKSILTGASNGKGGTLTSELMKGYKNGWYVKGQGSIKRFGDLESPDYILSNTGISEKGVSLALGANKFTHGWDFYYSFYDAEVAVLASSHIGNVDDLIESINNGEPDIIRDFTYDILNPKQEVTHHLGKAKFFKRFEELGKLTVQYDFQNNQRFEFDTRRTAELSRRPSIDLELITHTLSADFNFDAKYNYNYDVGVMVRYQNNFADALETGVRRLIPDYDKYDIGAFVAGEYVITESLLLDAGVRYDFNSIDAKKFYLNSRWEQRGYEEDFSDIVIDRDVPGSQLLTNPIFEYHNVSATAGLQHKFGKSYEFKFNYALGQRAPNPSELFSDGLHHSAARIELGDLRIAQETSHKMSLSLQNETNKWGWEVAPYINYVNDYILLEPETTEFTIRGAFPVWRYRQTDARLIGLDTKVFVNWLSYLSTYHNFSLVKGTEVQRETPLINMPPANFNNKITYRNTDWFNFESSLESQYTFRQNEFPDNIVVFSPDAGENVLLEINTPPQAYHLLNFDAQMSFKLGDKSNLKTGITINNLLDTTYRNYLNRLRYFADDLGRNFLLRLSINY